MLSSLIALCATACNSQPSAPVPQERGQEQQPTAPADPYAFAVQPEPANQPLRADSILQAQVALDRTGFSPGVIDGKAGMSFTDALRGFQQARGLPDSGKYHQTTAKDLMGANPQNAT